MDRSAGSGRSGRRQVLSSTDEELIVVAINKCASMGWPIGFDDIKPLIKSYLDGCKQVTMFKDNLPEDWCISFKKRHADAFRCKKPEILRKKRSDNMSKENLNHFYDMVTKVYQETGLSDAADAAERIYNLDETGFNTNPCAKKLFFPKQARDAYMLTPNYRKTMYTVLFAGNAAGEYVPPMVVYKVKSLYQTWTEKGPDNCHQSGWMEDYVLENWFKECFCSAVLTKVKPVIVYLDGHGSHLTYNTVLEAIKQGIEIICIPPSTSHALQPMDVAVLAH